MMTQNEVRKNQTVSSLFTGVFLLTAIFFFIAVAATNIPVNFPTRQVVSISSGQGLTGLANTLKSDGVISFAEPLKLVLFLSGKQHSVQAGDYYFERPLTIFELSWRLANGYHNIQTIRVTIPEGTTNAEIADILASSSPKLINFNKARFLELTNSKEGYLFPDTYFFPENETASDVVGVMEENFNKKIATAQQEIDSFAYSSTSNANMSKWSEATLKANVVIMASILEKEATTDDDRRVVAGILWKRMAIGMPLELDSTLQYATGHKYIDDADLASTTPYNTYRHKGLPPAPIDDPGLGSIIDAVSPEMTQYLYFISDSSGNMHYETTFAEHQADISKYLGN